MIGRKDLAGTIWPDRRLCGDASLALAVGILKAEGDSGPKAEVRRDVEWAGQTARRKLANDVRRVAAGGTTVDLGRGVLGITFATRRWADSLGAPGDLSRDLGVSATTDAKPVASVDNG